MLAEERYRELYITHADVVGDGFPIFFNALRRGYMEDLTACGLPDRHDERYRLSDMQELFSRPWRHAFTPVAGRAGRDGGGVLLLENGFTVSSEPLATLGSGVVCGSLRAAAFDHEEVIGKYYGSVAANKSEAVTALNSLFVQDGGFVYIPAGADVEEPVEVEFDFEPREDMQMFFSRLLVVAERGARAEVVVRLRSQTGLRILVDHVAEVCLAEGARVGFTHSTDLGRHADVVAGNYFSLMEDSLCKGVSMDSGSGTVRHNYKTDLRGRGADSRFYGVYIAGGTQHTDLDVSVDHLAPDCRSEELVKGVAGGEAVGSFTGRIYVAPDAQRTEGCQQSRNLQLSPAARMYSKPRLEIYADDVKCSHGATVGQIGDDAIYYMRQRGIGEDDARGLLMAGFVDDVLEHCGVESEKERLMHLAAIKLGTVLG